MRRVLRYASLGLERRGDLEIALAHLLSSRVALGDCRSRESFADANALLAECARRGLEGIVAKRKDAPYRSGPRCGWVKVKTAEWRAANQYRAKLFERR